MISFRPRIKGKKKSPKNNGFASHNDSLDRTTRRFPHNDSLTLAQSVALASSTATTPTEIVELTEQQEWDLLRGIFLEASKLIAKNPTGFKFKDKAWLNGYSDYSNEVKIKKVAEVISKYIIEVVTKKSKIAHVADFPVQFNSLLDHPVLFKHFISSDMSKHEIEIHSDFPTAYIGARFFNLNVKIFQNVAAFLQHLESQRKKDNALKKVDAPSAVSLVDSATVAPAKPEKSAETAVTTTIVETVPLAGSRMATGLSSHRNSLELHREAQFGDSKVEEISIPGSVNADAPKQAAAPAVASVTARPSQSGLAKSDSSSANDSPHSSGSDTPGLVRPRQATVIIYHPEAKSANSTQQFDVDVLTPIAKKQRVYHALLAEVNAKANPKLAINAVSEYPDFLNNNSTLIDYLKTTAKNDFLDMIINDLIDDKKCNWHQDVITLIGRSLKDDLHARLMTRLNGQDNESIMLRRTCESDPKHTLGKIFRVQRGFGRICGCFFPEGADGVVSKVITHLATIDEALRENRERQALGMAN